MHHVQPERESEAIFPKSAGGVKWPRPCPSERPHISPKLESSQIVDISMETPVQTLESLPVGSYLP